MAISGESGSDLQTEIDSCGFTDFYAKPVKKNHVEDIVKQFCGLAVKHGNQHADVGGSRLSSPFEG